MSEIKPLARKANIVVQDLKDETLVYDLNSNKALTLNQTSAIVWENCTGHNSISQIADLLSSEHNKLVSEDLVLMSLEQLKQADLIENESLQITTFEGLSRREMVKRIGFASMVALPVISSLVAPHAVNAASICFPITNNANENPNGCVCDTNSDCITNCCGTTAAPFKCVAINSVTPCQPCRTNCECNQPTYSCPSIAGRPRICRPVGVPVPPLPAPDNCV